MGCIGDGCVGFEIALDIIFGTAHLACVSPIQVSSELCTIYEHAGSGSVGHSLCCLASGKRVLVSLCRVSRLCR